MVFITNRTLLLWSLESVKADSHCDLVEFVGAQRLFQDVRNVDLVGSHDHRLVHVGGQEDEVGLLSYVPLLVQRSHFLDHFYALTIRQIEIQDDESKCVCRGGGQKNLVN